MTAARLGRIALLRRSSLREMGEHWNPQTELMTAFPELSVSIIIPVVNEASIIAEAINSLGGVRGNYEVIIVDGGSDDETCQLASAVIRRASNYRLISAARGRGIQMNAGASIARGRALLFLHADTRLPVCAVELIERAMEDSGIVGGNFQLKYDGADLFSLIFTRLNAVRRSFGIYYGDSAIWARREVFRAIGGFTNPRLMEDYEFCRGLERAGHTVCFSDQAVTSSRRWRQYSVISNLIVWVLIQWLYMLGVSSDRLARLYYPE
jgi:rSAM/selenodomain-associated transferase 2